MTKKAAVGPLLLCLTMCAGCCSKTAVETRYVATPIPAMLTAHTPEPAFTGTTNADLLNWALDVRDALRLCNADKDAITAIQDHAGTTSHD